MSTNMSVIHSLFLGNDSKRETRSFFGLLHGLGKIALTRTLKEE